MKVAIDLEKKIIIDILPDKATDENKFVVNNGYKILELEEVYTEDGTFRELNDLDLSSILIKDANEQFVLNMKYLKESVPEEEILTWTEQKQEALAWDADENTDTPMIDGILKTRSKYSKRELVDKVLEKAAAYSSLSGELIGIRQDLIDRYEEKRNE